MAILEVMESELEQVILKNPFVLVDYTAVWCGPCKLQKEILIQLTTQFPDVKIVSLDIDKNRDLSSRMKIASIPALQFYRKGKVLVFKMESGIILDRLVGVQSLEVLTEILNYYKNPDLISTPTPPTKRDT